MQVGIALGGGGAKGLAHIGVLRVLESAQVPLDLIAGTSAGSMVGALYAAGKSPDDIERIARRVRLSQLLTRDRSGMGLFSTDGIRRIIEMEIGMAARIEELPRTFAAVAVDVDSGAEVVFDHGSVADAVCASCAFPGLFAPVRIDGRCYFDGGVTNSVPFDVVRRRGADRVIAVDLGADEPFFTVALPHRRQGELFYRLLFLAGNQKTLRVASRAIGIMSKQMRQWKLEQSPPDSILRPAVQGVGLMDFDLAKECVAAGEKAARAALPQIERLIAMPRWEYESRKMFARVRRSREPRAA
jgi:NTE family protein